VVAGCVPQGEKDIEDLDKISVVGVTNIDRVVEVVNETMKGNVVKF
jgi:threonylcarbamoyladenosine tRNA methylthiotransferase CDKAL1